MTEPSRLHSAKAVEEAAADWLERRETANWSVEDQSALDNWLAQAAVHRIAYLRLKSAWSRADRLVVLRPQFGNAPASQPRVRPAAFRIAAGILVLIAGTTAVRDVASSRTYSTGLGEHRTVTLSDGTRVELNTNTLIREGNTEKSRIVFLEQGEAYFDVRHNASKPFIVKLGQHSVTDIGTKFFIRCDVRKLAIGVTEGRVELTAANDGSKKRIFLDAGKLAVVTSGRISVQTQAAQTLAEELAWRDGMLVFNHTTLTEAAAEFNRYNEEKLVIADPRAANLLIGGTFRQSDVRQFARVARAILGIHIKDKPSEQVISLSKHN